MTEESNTIPQLTQVVDNSPRKRKRGSEGSAAPEEIKPDLTSPSKHAGAAGADTDMVNGEAKRGGMRVRVRTSRNQAASATDSSREASAGPNGIHPSGEQSGSSTSDGQEGKKQATKSAAARKPRVSGTSIQELSSATLPSSQELFLESEDAEKLRVLLQQ